MAEGGQQFGKYRILEELGAGGFATVYKAVDTTLDREVALKILHPPLLTDRRFVQNFRQEAKTLAALRHPQIITVYEVGEVEGRLFIAMDLAHGLSLAKSIAKRGRIPWDETLALLKPVCEALDYAHGQKVIHRDLKPANLLLDTQRGALLTDFGFARLMAENSASMSMSGGIVGTPGYIAPEVWEENAASPPVDIYALGCIVYEMLTGDVLFKGQTPIQAMRAHDRGPQFPATWPESVPASITTVLNKALARDPAARYPSAGALWHALNDLEAQAQAAREAAQRTALAAQWRAEAERALAAKEWDAARMAIGRWRSITPDDPALREIQARLERLSVQSTIPSEADPPALKHLSRRDFLRIATVGLGTVTGGSLLAIWWSKQPAGGRATPTGPTMPPAMLAPIAASVTQSTAIPAPTQTTMPTAAAPTAAASPQPQPTSIGTIKDVPRNQTAILGWSISSPIGVVNPWAVPGYTHQEGNAMMWEPLSYFGIFSDKEIPWLAESMKYSKPDFTELKIVLNKAAQWSDGSPVTSKDVVFTFEGQMKNDKLPYHAQFDQFVQDVKADDDQNVTVTFKIPAPRFAFEVLTLKFDTGIPIVPAVLGQQADVNAYQGGLEMIHSGPYDLVSWDKNQKIYDLRDSWWAVKGGVATLPEVKRIIFANIGGQVGQGMDIVAQRVVNNEFDATLDMRSAVIGNILKQNPKVTSHTGDTTPYGYLDWWPNSLWVNTQLAPYSDANVRLAMSLTIDRDKIDEIIYEGAKIATIYPFPLYPGLVKFVESPAVKALEAKYEPRKFDPAASAQLMKDAGFTMNADELWEKDGATVNMVIQGFEGIHGDIVPVLVEMLHAGGFDANVNFGTDAYQNMADGKPGAYMFGHGASLKDPYAALDLFHSKYSAAVGTTVGNNRFSRYKNPEYDKLLDEMAPLDSGDPKFQENATKALEIYWRDQIDIPIIQWLHRIPYNQTYWTNWPTAANLAGGTNGAFWSHTGMLVISQLKAAP